ncbi:MAG: putative toxin-antitoxin system toxin component, PIN family, partial [Candidatus Dormiibacterota bacterium]
PVEVPRVCRDPDDDQILAIAVVGAVDALVTGDGDLLALGTHRGVNISSVADFEVLARG